MASHGGRGDYSVLRSNERVQVMLAERNLIALTVAPESIGLRRWYEVQALLASCNDTQTQSFIVYVATYLSHARRRRRLSTHSRLSFNDREGYHLFCSLRVYPRAWASQFSLL